MADENPESKQNSAILDDTSKDNGDIEKSMHSVKSTSKSENPDQDITSPKNDDGSKASIQENENGEVGEGEGSQTEAEAEPKPFSYIAMLDGSRELPEPVNITLEYLKQISDELGLIKLCWPDLFDITFEGRTNFPESYLKSSNKEKLLLLYAENFRRQFCHTYPDRKPLFLACDNECGMQKMVCTTIRPTTLPYSAIYSWQECAKFVADHLKYEPLEEPVLISLDLKGELIRAIVPKFLGV